MRERVALAMDSGSTPFTSILRNELDVLVWSRFA
jgi:hypothetical protein